MARLLNAEPYVLSDFVRELWTCPKPRIHFTFLGSLPILLSSRYRGGFLLRPYFEGPMPIVPVSLNGESPTMRTVQPRTSKLQPGVLCEVWADNQMHLCIVESTNSDGSIKVRELPEAPEIKSR
jgi:hypothetical protein